INVIARQMPDGAVYPPPPGTVAFPTAPTIDSFGIPSAPPFQTATAPLSIVSSDVTGEQFGTGTYKISGLPPGQYLVEIQSLNPDALGGSSIGQFTQAAKAQVLLPVLEEFYNGATTSNSPSNITRVAVTAGQTTSNINLFVNGLSQSLQAVAQTPGNNSKPAAESVPVPSEITGAITVNDFGKLKIDLGGGNFELVQNMYKVSLTSAQSIFLTLDGDNVSGDPGSPDPDDIDLFLFDSGVKKKSTSPSDSHMLGFSAGPTPHEVIGTVALNPGTYYIGVACASGSQPAYKLRVFVRQ
ncbi:MAG: PPC domain-containing protein, partial [Blastocatellia bacterium]